MFDGFPGILLVLALLMVLVFDTILCLMDSLLIPWNTFGLGFTNGASV